MTARTCEAGPPKADFLRQNSGQPSGPGDLMGFSCFRLSSTMAGVIVISVSIELQLLGKSHSTGKRLLCFH